MWPFNKRREQQIVHVIITKPNPPNKATAEIKIGDNWITDGELGLIIAQIDKPNPNPWRLFKGKPIQLPYLLKGKFQIGDIFYFLVRGNLQCLEYLLVVRGEEVLTGNMEVFEKKFNLLKNTYWADHVSKSQAMANS